MKKFASAATLLLAMGAAQAQGYVEGAFGAASMDADCTDTVSCDKSGTGFKLLGGFKINQSVALEIGYLNFGEVKARYSYFSYDDSRITVKSNAFYAGAAMRAELGSGFGLVGRLGLANVKTEADDWTDGWGADHYSESSVNPVFGLGVEYAVNKQLRLTGSVDFTQSAEDSTGDKSSLRLMSIGARFEF